MAQIEVASLEVDKNRQRIMEIAETEARDGTDLIVFPELCLTGYIEPMAPGHALSADEDFAAFAQRFYAATEALDGPTVTGLTAIAGAHDAHIVIGMALRHDQVSGSLTNSSVLIGPSGVLAVYDKVHLWQNEKLFFRNGNGFPVRQTNIGRIGMQVCYDIRFPEVSRCLMLNGAEIVTNVWASFRPIDTAPKDPAQFRHRAFTRAQENGFFFLSCNRVGQQGAHHFMGHSVICGPDGTVLAEAAHEDATILHAELDMSEIVAYRRFVNLIDDRQPSTYSALIAPSSNL